MAAAKDTIRLVTHDGGVTKPTEPAKVVALPGIVRVLQEALDRAHRGEIVGITVIEFAPDWSWSTHNAGSVLRVPAIGIAAAHLLASRFEEKLRGM